MTGVPGQPAWLPGSSIGGPGWVNARARKIPAQLVEDEDYQLRHERVAGIDVAKAKADVCTRLPPARDGGRRASRVEEVPATAREILALAGRLLADGVELVVMEATSDYWRIWYYLLEAAGLNVQLVNPAHARQLAGRPKTDRLDAQWIARLAEMGLLRPVVRAAAGDPGAARPDPHPAAAGPRPHPRVAAAGEAAGGRPGQAVVRGALAGQDQDRPRHPGGDRRRRARPEGPGRPGRTAGQGRARRRRAGPGGHDPRRSPPHADPASTWTTSRSWTGPSPRSRTRSRPPWTRSPPPGASAPTASRPPTPARTPRSCPPRSGSRRSPASASGSPWRSSPRPAWT